MPRNKNSEVDPYDRKTVAVLDSEISYIDVGEGDSVVFIHGNGTFSYVWRNVIPYVESLGRCLAMDLMGYGKSGDIPSGSDGIPDQARVKSITYMETLITPLSMISGNSILKQNLGQVSIIFQ